MPFRARIVCASNVDLESAVEKGTFRPDLFFRINVVTIEVPPLRARLDDIPPLLEKFAHQFSLDHGKTLNGISPLAESLALSHDWPGNVRELRNRAERAVALASGDRLGPSDLFPDWAQADSLERADEFLPLAEVRIAAERLQIERALSRTDGRIAKAAELLGISRTTMWEKMRQFQLQAPD